MTEETVYLDIEARFSSGYLLCLTVLDGRDRLLTDGQHLTIEIHDTPETPDITVLDRAKLDTLRTTRRVVTPEPTTTDGGTVQLTGDTPTA